MQNICGGEASEVMKKVSIVDTVINRMASLRPMADIEKDFAANPGKPVCVVQAEQDMPLYAQSGDPIIDSLRQIKSADDMSVIQVLKNKLSNGPHAIGAWYGMLFGHQTISNAFNDIRVINLVQSIMENEVKPALMAEFPSLDEEHYDTFITTFMQRCKEATTDPCKRVGRNVKLKLGPDERVMGTIKVAKKHGISCEGLEFGAACAITYAILLQPDDPNDPEIKESLLIQKVFNKAGLASVMNLLKIQNQKNIAEKVTKLLDIFGNP